MILWSVHNPTTSCFFHLPNRSLTLLCKAGIGNIQLTGWTWAVKPPGSSLAALQLGSGDGGGGSGSLHAKLPQTATGGVRALHAQPDGWDIGMLVLQLDGEVGFACCHSWMVGSSSGSRPSWKRWPTWDLNRVDVAHCSKTLLTLLWNIVRCRMKSAVLEWSYLMILGGGDALELEPFLLVRHLHDMPGDGFFHFCPLLVS